jgi:hypothetical protein
MNGMRRGPIAIRTNADAYDDVCCLAFHRKPQVTWYIALRCIRQQRFPSWRPASTNNSERAKLPQTLANIVLSGRNGT